MKRAIGAVAAAFVAATAWAGDAPPAKDAVEIKLAAKVGDELRFRETQSSNTEVDGRPYAGDVTSHEFVVMVKAVRPDGGVDVEVTFERIDSKLLNKYTNAWMEIDSSKPVPSSADTPTQAMSAFTHAIVGVAFKVALDVHGAATSVSGLREAVAPKLRADAKASVLPIDQMLSDDECLSLVTPLFCSAPTGPHVVGATWIGDEKADESGEPTAFSFESTLAAVTADDAVVTSKFTWKPGAEETNDGVKAVGGGDSTAKFSRKDGLVLSMKRHLEANRDGAKSKATSRADWTIERVPLSDKTATDPKKRADPPPTPKK